MSEENSGKETKKYSLPSTSPFLGLRVVWDTVNANVQGCAANSLSDNVPLPTPEGPQRTTDRPSLGRAAKVVDRDSSLDVKDK